MMDLDFGMLGGSSSAAPAATGKDPMFDMFASLDALGEPTPAPTGSSPVPETGDAAVNAWLDSLPALSFMLADKLALPA